MGWVFDCVWQRRNALLNALLGATTRFGAAADPRAKAAPEGCERGFGGFARLVEFACSEAAKLQRKAWRDAHAHTFLWESNGRQ